MSRKLYKYLRLETFPTPLCPGCGHGILLGAMLRSIDELALEMNKTLFVSGIGCAGLILTPHLAADTMHVTHGRAIPFALGVKKVNPELKVVVVSGDGDLSSIGGNHLVHAARRNIDITVICANNQVYAQTGGQAAATTPLGAVTRTTPEGSRELPLDLCKLVAAAGAAYVARFSVYQIRPLIRSIKMALVTRGFSFIDCISPCPVEYGKMNRFASSAEMLRSLRLNCVPGDIITGPSEKGVSDRICIGEYTRR